MKKFLAVALAVVMMAVMAVSASAVYNPADTTECWVVDHALYGTDDVDAAADGTLFLSFDTFFIDGESMMDMWGTPDGTAQESVTENKIATDADSYLTFRGWAGFKSEEDFNLTWGYKINEGEPVFDDEFLYERGDVQSLVGYFANGYEIDVPLTTNTEATLVTICAKDAAGKITDIIEVSANGAYTAAAAPAAAEEPATAEEPVVIAPAPAAAQTADLAVVAIIALGAVAVAKKH